MIKVRIKTMIRKFSYIHFLASIILVGGILVLLIFIQSLMNADPGVTAAVIGIIGATILGIWTHYLTKSREIKSRHFVEKRDTYIQLIELIYDMLKAVKKGEELLNEDMIQRMLGFKKDLLIWDSQDVIKALQKYEKYSYSATSENGLGVLLVVDDLLRAIRKDLGHNDNNLLQGELVLLQVISEDREKLLSEIHNGIK